MQERVLGGYGDLMRFHDGRVRPNLDFALGTELVPDPAESHISYADNASQILDGPLGELTKRAFNPGTSNTRYSGRICGSGLRVEVRAMQRWRWLGTAATEERCRVCSTCAFTCKRSREIHEEGVYSGADIVAYWSDVFEREASGVWQLPVEVALAGVNGAGIAAAHRDHNVSGLYLIGGEPLRNLT